jgi:hypothetical protein
MPSCPGRSATRWLQGHRHDFCCVSPERGFVGHGVRAAGPPPAIARSGRGLGSTLRAPRLSSMRSRPTPSTKDLDSTTQGTRPALDSRRAHRVPGGPIEPSGQGSAKRATVCAKLSITAASRDLASSSVPAPVVELLGPGRGIGRSCTCLPYWCAWSASARSPKTEVRRPRGQEDEPTGTYCR